MVTYALDDTRGYTKGIYTHLSYKWVHISVSFARVTLYIYIYIRDFCRRNEKRKKKQAILCFARVFNDVPKVPYRTSVWGKKYPQKTAFSLSKVSRIFICIHTQVYIYMIRILHTWFFFFFIFAP